MLRMGLITRSRGPFFCFARICFTVQIGAAETLGTQLAREGTASERGLGRDWLPEQHGRTVSAPETAAAPRHTTGQPLIHLGSFQNLVNPDK